MPTLLYAHGFLSSPGSQKASETASWLKQHRPTWRFVCPALSSYPAEAHAELLRVTEAELAANEEVYVIGSSLGGFWATCLAERFGCKAVLINPAVNPYERFRQLVGQTLKNYHTDATYKFAEADLKFLADVDVRVLRRPERCWLLVQTGDETLDYRDAVKKYAKCRQTIEEGGDHAFVGYLDHLPGIVEFFEQQA